MPRHCQNQPNGTNIMIIASQRHTAQTFPGLSIEHGQIYQHGKPRSVAMNGRGIPGLAQPAATTPPARITPTRPAAQPAAPPAAAAPRQAVQREARLAPR